MERRNNMSVETFVESVRPVFGRLMTEVGGAVNGIAHGGVYCGQHLKERPWLG